MYDRVKYHSDDHSFLCLFDDHHCCDTCQYMVQKEIAINPKTGETTVIYISPDHYDWLYWSKCQRSQHARCLRE